MSIGRTKPKFDVCENAAYVHSLNSPAKLLTGDTLFIGDVGRPDDDQRLDIGDGLDGARSE